MPGDNGPADGRPARRPKSSAAEVMRRVEEVLRIRLDGAQYHDIPQYASEKGWGVTERQVAIRRVEERLLRGV